MGLFDFFRKDKHYKKKSSTNIQVNDKLHELGKDIETQRQGFLELSEICLNESNKSKLAEFIETLKDHTGDEEYITTLNYVIDWLYQERNYFIICLDWKQEITSLTHVVNHILTENFNQQIELPKQEDYGPKASVSYDNVLKDFDKVISKIGFQLSFMDTNSDQYVVVIHKIEDRDKAKNAIQKIDYDCLGSNSRKISG